jgi:hypothetical protein
MNNELLRPVQPGEPISAAKFNALLDVVRRIAGLTVAPPLQMIQSGAGTTLTLADENACIVTVTGALAGVGKYTGQVIVENPTLVSGTNYTSCNGTQSVCIADTAMTAVEDVHVWNMAENLASGRLNGATAVRHIGLTNGAFVGKVIGVENPASGTVMRRVVAISVPVTVPTFPVRVEKDGGSNGTATSVASYTYTVRDFASGLTLATNAAQVHPRAYGAVDFQAGTNGVGIAYQSGTSVALYLAGEVPQVSTCE